jgi:hypothetical protein
MRICALTSLYTYISQSVCRVEPSRDVFHFLSWYLCACEPVIVYVTEINEHSIESQAYTSTTTTAIIPQHLPLKAQNGTRESDASGPFQTLYMASNNSNPGILSPEGTPFT